MAPSKGPDLAAVRAARICRREQYPDGRPSAWGDYWIIAANARRMPVPDWPPNLISPVHAAHSAPNPAG